MTAPAIFNGILQQGIGPIFVRSANPTLYPFILIALLVAVLLTVREVFRDTRYYFTHGRSGSVLRYDMLINVGSLLASWLIIYGLWICFTVPFDQLPIWHAPAAGATFGPFVAHDVYYFFAVVLHIAVAFFGLQLLAGFWSGFVKPASLPTQRITDPATILSTALAIFGWEAQRWDPNYIIPTEISLAFIVAMLLVRIFTLKPATSDRAIRTQLIAIALVSLVGVAVVWWAHSIGIPDSIAQVIYKSDNPRLYPIALILGALMLLSSLVSGALTPIPAVKRESLAQNAAGGMLSAWGFLLLLLWATWWGVTSNYTLLPFVSANPRWVVFGLPLSGAIVVVAIIIHATVFALGISNLLTTLAAGLLRIPSRVINNGVFAVLAYALVAYALHLLGWPQWVVALLEIVALTVILAQQDAWVDALLGWMSASTPADLRSVQRYKSCLKNSIYFLAVVAIVLTNVSSIYLLTFFGLFYMMTLLDTVIADFWSAVVAKKVSGPIGLLSPRRWYLTMPLVIAITLAGAAGLFRALAPSGALAYDFWLEAGAAAAAYMIFEPLITFANYNAATRSKHEDENLTPGELIERLLNAQAQFANAAANAGPPLGRNIPGLPGLPGIPGLPATTTSRTGPANKQSQQGEERAQVIRSSLQLPLGNLFFLLLVALAYHALTSYLHLNTLLSTGFVPLVFGLVALAAGLLQVIDVSAMNPPRYVSLLLVFFVIALAGVSTIFSLAHLPPALTSQQIIGGGFLSAITSEAFLTNSGFTVLREFLFLLTLGQLVYLFRLIETSLYADQRAPTEEREAEDGANENVELGDWLAERGDRDKAIRAYRAALQEADKDPSIIREAGLGLQRQQQFADALAAYQRAIDLDPENAIYYNDKGVALGALDRPQEAIAAYDEAIKRDSAYALAYDNKGDELLLIGSFVAAAQAYRSAVEQATENKDVYWNDVAYAESNLRHYDRALEAVNEALKIDEKWATAWRNKASILLNMPDHERDALTAAEKSLELQATSARGWAFYGEALNLNDKVAEARAAYEHALTCAATSAGDLEGRANALAALGSYDSALTTIEQAIASSPNDPDYVRSKARILRAMGRNDEATQAEARERELTAEAPAVAS